VARTRGGPFKLPALSTAEAVGVLLVVSVPLVVLANLLLDQVTWPDRVERTLRMAPFWATLLVLVTGPQRRKTRGVRREEANE
jgi:hypothetical protein